MADFHPKLPRQLRPKAAASVASCQVRHLWLRAVVRPAVPRHISAMKSIRSTSLRYLTSGLLLASLITGTAMSQSPDTLVVPQGAIATLDQIVTEPKFRADPSGLYAGIPTEPERQAAEAAINDLASHLSGSIAAHPSKAYVLGEITKTLPAFEDLDSEDKDRALEYIESIMDAVGLESSDGLLNRWRYGFDPNELHSKKP